MRILMLGWEFPPFIAGGLGTACFGLTRALNRAGHEILFVLPKPIGQAHAEHVKLYGPDGLRPILAHEGRDAGRAFTHDPEPQAMPDEVAQAVIDRARIIEETIAQEEPAGSTTLLEVEAPFASPYGGGPGMGGYAAGSPAQQRLTRVVRELTLRGDAPAFLKGMPPTAAASVLSGLFAIEQMTHDGDDHYSTDLFGDADRYAQIVAALGHKTDFDVIHAHDWLTYPAGVAARAVTGKPLVCHMHATEFDRSGEHINQQVYDIERMGVHAADRVIAVSQLTREILINRYGVEPGKVDVVYNGVDKEGSQPVDGVKIEKDDRIILFLGRITMQKGPEYFIRAAKRVLEKVDKVKFVVAGSGDMAQRMIEEAARLGIGHKVLFTGFLRGRDVERVFKMADCFVMPSVSEPFGIVALEAIIHDTPVIISKQSGVSEVLSHALKVDFWDVDDMANKIVAVMKYPPLSATLREHGEFDVRRLTWADSARKVVASYGQAMAARFR